MKRTFASVMFVGLVTASAAVFAQDARAPSPSEQQLQDQEQYSQDRYTTTAPDSSSTSTTTTPRTSKHEEMKDCVAREQASNSTMSKSDAKKVCHDALKAQRDEQRANPDNEPQPPR